MHDYSLVMIIINSCRINKQYGYKLSNTKASSLKYRPEIDGLRAIAVSLVIICHAGLGTPELSWLTYLDCYTIVLDWY